MSRSQSDSFEVFVQQSIGEVKSGSMKLVDMGTKGQPDHYLTQVEAAFLLIGRYGASGTYSFDLPTPGLPPEHVEVECRFPDLDK